MKYFCSGIFIFLCLVSLKNSAQCGLKASISSPAYICVGETATLSANWSSANGIVYFSWQWNEGNSTLPYIVVTPTATTDFALMVVEISNPYCYKKIELTLNVGVCKEIGEKSKLNDRINVYPNPGSGKFVAEFDQDDEKEITVLDVFGKAVYRSAVYGRKNVIDLSELPNGIYYMSVLSDGSSYKYKVIKCSL